MRSRYVYSGIVLLCAGVVLAPFSYRTLVPQFDSSTPSFLHADFGGVSLSIELATTTLARVKGLGGRNSLPRDYGMLFVFPKDDVYGFWMKDTLVPLDLFWLDSKGQVVSIATGVATSSYPHVFYPPVPVRYVLETVAGFARAHEIATGTPLHLQNFPTVLE